MSKVRSILIVDDNTDIIRSISKKIQIEYQGWEVLRASNGHRALKIARMEQPDMILMDWDMPIMDGIEATRMLRKDEDTHQIPIIMVTGQMTSSDDLQIALEAGATDYVRKPIDFIELKARMASVLRERQQHLAIQELLRSEIDLKNRKLSSTSMLIVEKNGLLTEFHQTLQETWSLLKHLDPKNQNLIAPNIKSLIRRISNHLETDNSWDTFKVHFDEVHPNFFDSLKQAAFIDLTFKDLKLCAYLKLGMDHKQIAQLLNIIPSSVRTAVYRLKKKFDIDQDDDLRDFIAGI